MFETDVMPGRFDRKGGPVNRLILAFSRRKNVRIEKNGESVPVASRRRFGKRIDETGNNHLETQKAHLSAVRSGELGGKEVSDEEFMREKRARRFGVLWNFLLGSALVIYMCCLGRKADIKQVLILGITFVASFIYSDSWHLFDKILAKKSRPIVTLATILLIWPLILTGWYAAFAVALSIIMYVVVYSMNETWLSDQNFLMSVEAIKVLHGGNETDADTYWQANGCRELRTMYWAAGQFPNDTEIERQLKPAFFLGFFVGQKRIRKECETERKLLNKQVTELQKKLAHWNEGYVTLEQYEIAVKQSDMFFNSSESKTVTIEKMAKEHAELKKKYDELSVAFEELSAKDEQYEAEQESIKAELEEARKVAEDAKQELALSNETEEDKVRRLFLEGNSVRTVQRMTSLSNGKVQALRSALVAEGKIQGGSPIKSKTLDYAPEEKLRLVK